VGGWPAPGLDGGIRQRQRPHILACGADGRQQNTSKGWKGFCLPTNYVPDACSRCLGCRTSFPLLGLPLLPPLPLQCLTSSLGGCGTALGSTSGGPTRSSYAWRRVSISDSLQKSSCAADSCEQPWCWQELALPLLHVRVDCNLLTRRTPSGGPLPPSLPVAPLSVIPVPNPALPSPCRLLPVPLAL